MFFKRAFLAIGIALLVCSFTCAQTYTFVPGGANDWWETASNWDLPGIPNGTDVIAVFDASVNPDYSTNTHSGNPYTVGELHYDTTSNWRMHNNERDIALSVSSGNALVTQNGSGTITFDCDLRFDSTTTFGGTGTGDIIVNGSILGGGNRLGLFGTGGLVKEGSYTLTVRPTGSYSGGTTVNDGTLRLEGSHGWDSGIINHDSTYTINAGGTVEWAGYGVARHGDNYIINGGTLDTTDATGEHYLNTIDMTGGTIQGTGVNSAVRFGYHSNATVTTHASADTAVISVPLRLVNSGTQTVTFDVADGAAASDLTLNGVIYDYGGLAGLRVIKTGDGTMTLTNTSNSWDGGLSINGGTVSVSQLTGGNNNGQLGGWYGTSAYFSFDGGTLEYTGGSVSGINRAFLIEAGGATIDIANPAATVEWVDTGGAGPITGTGSLTKAGPGTLQLSSNNNYAGGAVISQGTLRVTSGGALGSGDVTLGDVNTGTSDVQLTIATTIGNDIIVSNNGTGTATIYGDAQYNNHNGTITLDRDAVFEIPGTGTGTDWWYSFGNGGISGSGAAIIRGGDGGNTAADAGNRVAFGGNNTYTGGTVIESGKLQLNSAGAAGTGTITLGNTNTGSAVTQLRVGGNIANDIVVSADAPGSAAGIGTYNGLQVLSGGLQIDRPVTLYGAGDRLTWSGTGAVWSGAGDITISGGRVTHEGTANTWTGDMTINAGSIFQPGHAQSLTAANSVTANGTLQLNNVNQTIDGLSGSGIVKNIVGGNTLTIGAGDASATFSGNIQNGSGTMSIIKTGTGTQTFSSANSYTGGTTISDGTLYVTNSGALGSGTLTIDGGTLQTSVNIGNSITLNATPNVIAPNGNYRQLTGQISGPGGFTLASGGGTPGLQLTNPANNFLGDVTIDAGTYLRLTTSEVIPNTANVINNEHLRLDVPGGGVETIAGLSGTGSVWIPTSNNNDHTLIVGANDATATFNGSIGRTGQNNAYLNLTKIGAGTQTLAGAAYYGGDTTVNGGTLRITGSVGFPGAGSTGKFGAGSAITINSGGTLQLEGSWVTGGGLVNPIDVNGGTLYFADGGNYQGLINLTGGAIVANTGGDRTWRVGNWGSGVITVNASATSSTINGPLCLVGTGAAPTITFDVADGAATYDLDMNSTIYDHPGFDGQMTLVKDGAGTMRMSGASTFTGGSVISEGTLILNNNNGLGPGTITLGDANSGAGDINLYAAGNVDPGNNIVVSNQGTGTVRIGANGTGNSNNIFTGTVELNRATTMMGDQDRTSFNNVISGNPGLITIARSPDLTGTTTGRVTWEQNNTFSGDIDILPYAILQVGGGSGASQIPYGSNVNIQANGQLWLVYDDEAIGGLSGDGHVQFYPGNSYGATTLTVGEGDANATFGGTISNGAPTPMNLVKIDNGTQVLSGANTYTGTTTINGGTLQIGQGGNGSIVSLTTVNSGGTLAGTGQVNNHVAVNSGGAVSPGDNGGAAVGTLTVGSATFQPGSTLTIDLDPSQPGNFTPTGWGGVATAAASDTLDVGGLLDLGGSTLDLRAVSDSFARGQEFNILDFDLGLNDSDGDGQIDTHFDEYIIPYLGSNGYATLTHDELVDSQFLPDLGETGEGGGMLAWDFTDLYSQGIIRVVPEPATWAIFGLGLLGVGWFVRRRRKI